MKSRRLSFLAAAVTFAVAGIARAEDAPKSISFVFNVGANTDYELRGISQTDNKPSVFAGADATIEGIGYAGVWLSNVDFRNGTKLEYDIYGGVRPVIEGVTVDVGVIRYGYTSQPPGPKEVYTEWKVAPSMAIGPATIGLAYFYSDDFFGGTGPANYFEINGSTSIGGTPWSISGALGHQQVKGPFDYTTWNLGIGYSLNSRVGFDLRYWDTNEHGLGDIYKSKVVFGVKATFP